MHPPQLPKGATRKSSEPDRTPIRIRNSRLSVYVVDCFLVVCVLALALWGTFQASEVQADEFTSVRRSGEVGNYEAIPISSLPHHRPPSVTSSSPSGRPDPVKVLEPARGGPPESKRAASSLHARVRTRVSGHNPQRSDSTSPLAGPSSFPLIDGKLARGQSLSTVLRARGIPASMIRLIDRQIRPQFDFRRSQPGHVYRLVRDASGDLAWFRYRLSSEESIVMRRIPSRRDGWVEAGAARFQVSREYARLRPQITRLQGSVKSSLYLSIRRLGEDPTLASAFADIFAWDIDFTRQLKSGDDFTILYERLYRDDDGTPVYVRPGRILAARLDGAVGEHTAVYFEEAEGIGHYYRPDGDTLEKEFLAAPLEYGRVSSKYSSARHHPILNVVRPHHGIDYAAREGTPLWSVADGTVIFRGANGGFGKLVKIRHANGYVSYYPHLSGYGKGLKVGQKVLQKQVIGYVGQTGLATGPHVCFRVTKNGHYVNPSTLNSSKPVVRSVQDESWAEFEMVRDHLLSRMYEGGTPELAENAL